MHVGIILFTKAELLVHQVAAEFQLGVAMLLLDHDQVVGDDWVDDHHWSVPFELWGEGSMGGMLGPRSFGGDQLADFD
jgi:hypothetical protein